MSEQIYQWQLGGLHKGKYVLDLGINGVDLMSHVNSTFKSLHSSELIIRTDDGVLLQGNYVRLNNDQTSFYLTRVTNLQTDERKGMTEINLGRITGSFLLVPTEMGFRLPEFAENINPYDDNDPNSFLDALEADLQQGS